MRGNRDMSNFLKMLLLFLCLLFERIFAEVETSANGCTVSRCSHHGPAIRFPFWLKDGQPDHCGYPGFQLSCTEKHQTMIELPNSVKLLVKKINYKSQEIEVHDPDGCLPKQLSTLNLSVSPFQFKVKHDHSLRDITLFNCSLPAKRGFMRKIPCSSAPGYQVYVADSYYTLFNDHDNYDLLTCSKMYNISSVPNDIFKHFDLKWSKPICGHCEADGKRCRLKSNGTEPETECFIVGRRAQDMIKLAITGPSLGSFLLLLAVTLFYHVHSTKTSQRENQKKIEKFLEDYRALKPSRYSFADIKKITNQFQDKLGQGGYGTVYKGKLSSEVLVAVKILRHSKGNGEEFINEVKTMGRIHHVNVIRLVGFCADGFNRALIYEFLPNESLEKFIFSSPIKNHSLGWKKLRDIALGIAKGIEYLHQGCDQRILHFDIKPHNILLDHHLNPKISDFGLAKLCSKDHSTVSMTGARGTMGYIAPEVLSRNFGNVSYKSDVFSFGMLLLEMVGGRKNNDAMVDNTSQLYFPEWAYNRLDHGEELNIRIEDEGDDKIAKQLTIVGLWCIQWYPMDRPPMKAVVQMLEGEGDSLTTPPNPFASTGPTTISE